MDAGTATAEPGAEAKSESNRRAVNISLAPSDFEKLAKIIGFLDAYSTTEAARTCIRFYFERHEKEIEAALANPNAAARFAEAMLLPKEKKKQP